MSRRSLPNRSVAAVVLVAVLVLVVWFVSDHRTRGLLATTALLSVGTVLISLPLGVLFALLVARTDFPGRRSLGMLLVVLLFLPLYLQTGAWLAGFGTQGWFTVLTQTQNASQNELLAAVWIHGVAATAWVALIVGAGLRLVEAELEDEARLHGSNWKVISRVTLRRASGSIVIAALWVGLLAAGEMTVTDLLRVRTYAEEVYIAYAATGDMGEAALQVLPGVLITALLAIIGLAMCLRLTPLTQPVSFQRLRQFQLGRSRWPLAAIVAVLVIVLYGLPLANLVHEAGMSVVVSDDGQRLRNWSAVKILTLEALQPTPSTHQGPDGSWQFTREICVSMLLGVMTASATVLAATLITWSGYRRRIGIWTLYVLVGVLFALPGPLIGSAVSRVLVHIPVVYDSLAAPCLAQTLRTLPLAILIVWIGLRTVSRDVLEAGLIDGASSRSQLWHLALPSIWPVLVVAWLVSFLWSIGDLAASQLLLVPGSETLANRVFDRLHGGAYDQVSALFLVLLLFFGFVSAVIVWTLSWWIGRMSRATGERSDW